MCSQLKLQILWTHRTASDLFSFPWFSHWLSELKGTCPSLPTYIVKSPPLSRLTLIPSDSDSAMIIQLLLVTVCLLWAQRLSFWYSRHWSLWEQGWRLGLVPRGCQYLWTVLLRILERATCLGDHRWVLLWSPLESSSFSFLSLLC